MAQMVRLVLAASVGLALSGSLFAAAPTVTTEDFVDKIDSPWDMAFMKDGTMFFTEKCKGLSVRLPSGAINKLHGVGTTTGYSSASADLFCDGQAGMMGVAIDPQFASNRFIYVYSSSKLDGKLGNRVMRFKLNDAMTAVSDRTDIVADIGYKPKATKHPFGGPGAHNGGRIRFSPGDGFLYVTTGDNHLGIGAAEPDVHRRQGAAHRQGWQGRPGQQAAGRLRSARLHLWSPQSPGPRLPARRQPPVHRGKRPVAQR